MFSSRTILACVASAMCLNLASAASASLPAPSFNITSNTVSLTPVSVVNTTITGCCLQWGASPATYPAHTLYAVANNATNSACSSTTNTTSYTISSPTFASGSYDFFYTCWNANSTYIAPYQTNLTITLGQNTSSSSGVASGSLSSSGSFTNVTVGQNGTSSTGVALQNSTSSTGFASQNSTSSTGVVSQNSTSSTGVVSQNRTSSTGVASGLSSSSGLFNSLSSSSNDLVLLSSGASQFVSSSSGKQGNSTSSTGAALNGTSSTGSMTNSTKSSSGQASTGTMQTNGTSSTGSKTSSTGSSSNVQSSTGAVAPSVPENTMVVRFSVELSGTTVPPALAAAIQGDIAATIAMTFGLSADDVKPFVIVIIGNPVSASRRLLATSVPVTFTLLGNVTSVLPSTGGMIATPQVAAGMISMAITQGVPILSTATAALGVTVPIQPVEPENLSPASSSTGMDLDWEVTTSSSLSDGAIAGIVVGVVVGVLLLVGIAFAAITGKLCFGKGAASIGVAHAGSTTAVHVKSNKDAEIV